VARVLAATRVVALVALGAQKLKRERLGTPNDRGDCPDGPARSAESENLGVAFDRSLCDGLARLGSGTLDQLIPAPTDLGDLCAVVHVTRPLNSRPDRG
jgi:hypothetical protein